MKLISYNIQYGKGKDGRYDLARIAGEIEHGDVIALQEVERFWQRSGERDEPAELAARICAPSTGSLAPTSTWTRACRTTTAFRCTGAASSAP